MKTTIEIAGDLFERTQRLARKEKTTFLALAEAGLCLVLKEKLRCGPSGGQIRRTETGVRVVSKEKLARSTKWRWKPITRGGGFTEEFKNANWDKIRDEIYRGRGA
jgi:hypothetical protein